MREKDVSDRFQIEMALARWDGLQSDAEMAGKATPLRLRRRLIRGGGGFDRPEGDSEPPPPAPEDDQAPLKP